MSVRKVKVRIRIVMSSFITQNRAITEQVTSGQCQLVSESFTDRWYLAIFVI